jgi:hypothetical protein
MKRLISGQCCGGCSRGRISQPDLQQSGRKDRRRFLIAGTAQRSEAKEKREKDRGDRRRAQGRGLRDSIRKKDVARFDPRIVCRQFFVRRLQRGGFAQAIPLKIGCAVRPPPAPCYLMGQSA